MNYEVIALACEQLSYRDKLRLAQLLIQTARKEEENADPMTRAEPIKAKDNISTKEVSLKDIDTIEYIVERLLKLKPTKKKSVINSIKAMFQFQGGISDSDTDDIISELQKRKLIRIEKSKVSYL